MAGVKKGQIIEKKEKQTTQSKSTTSKNQRVTPQSNGTKTRSSSLGNHTPEAKRTVSSTGQKAYEPIIPVSHAASGIGSETPLYHTDFAGKYRRTESGREEKDPDFGRKAISGLIDYESDRLRSYAEERRKSSRIRWMEDLSYQAPSDAPSAAHGFQDARKYYARDKSYRQITKDWNLNDRLQFGYLYHHDPKAAEEYAAAVNDAISRAKKGPDKQNIYNISGSDFWSMKDHTANALVASTLFAIPQALDYFTEYITRGRLTERAYVTPLEYSQQVVSGVSDRLNGVDENGEAHYVLDEENPVIGGMGFGEGYRYLFDETLEKISRLSGLPVNSFQSFVTTIDYARELGVSDEQAIQYGLANATLSAMLQNMPIPELVEIGPNTSVMVGEILRSMSTKREAKVD